MENKNIDQQPKMGYTRTLAFASFAYGLWYIETTKAVIINETLIPSSTDSNVLWFLGGIIVLWGLGRATITDVARIWKSK